ncbi:FAD:protein FMN transferase [Mucilaginibacter conchicola]|uniref:FAD:protein FMN transferase n=1 Tax=Mucilaginibacter conchicola TaxID=2303333 RepID=A0A372NSX8_9SPHI|nr:FAD:protein FMN transferase [Mucilaginibacter conchicola]RFZ92348.1 FAD:protein FMN transferase [Mucilaginibacter conchicola]
MLALKNLTDNTIIFNRTTRLMGTEFDFNLVTDNAAWALQRIESAVNEITRIEKLLSTFNEDSSINLINRNAGIAPVRVDVETFKLVDRALQISALTHGTFDIAYGVPVNENESQTVAVKTRTLKKKVSLTNYINVELNHAKQTVFLKNAGMRISLSAIARGYAADRAKVVLQMEGVNSGVINMDGDLLTWGLQPDNTAWTIGTADSSKANEIYADVEISNMAVATSINTELVANRAVINAESGFPVSATKSISIISPTAELSGAMTGPMFGMGINTGLYLINKLNQIACIAVDDQERVYTSKHIIL